ncbi:MAG: HRDC domain-containing protein, partial [Deltaproteobacteria bacterium]|nr:HRDC domain-containing protein [Deltaproteobacteria bacterium]
WRLLKGEETPRLLRPAKKRAKVPKPAKDSWENVNRGLFEVLRNLRRVIANKRGVPAYIVFSDVTLRDMARRKPSTASDFLKVSGVGLKKEEQYGTTFLNAIKKYCLGNSIEMKKG